MVIAEVKGEYRAGSKLGALREDCSESFLNLVLELSSVCDENASPAAAVNGYGWRAKTYGIG